jgi:hypothetical protein
MHPSCLMGDQYAVTAASGVESNRLLRMTLCHASVAASVAASVHILAMTLSCSQLISLYRTWFCRCELPSL